MKHLPLILGGAAVLGLIIWVMMKKGVVSGNVQITPPSFQSQFGAMNNSQGSIKQIVGSAAGKLAEVGLDKGINWLTNYFSGGGGGDTMAKF